jgi:acetyl esterase/lipase
MVHGVFDSVMPPYTGRDYAAKVRQAGDRAEVVTIPGAGHFDVVIPTTAAWTEVVGIIDREMRALGHQASRRFHRPENSCLTRRIRGGLHDRRDR